MGAVYESDGTQLGSTGTFAGETTSDWQMQQLPTPVIVPAGTTFVVAVNFFARGRVRLRLRFFTRLHLWRTLQRLQQSFRHLHVAYTVSRWGSQKVPIARLISRLLMSKM